MPFEKPSPASTRPPTMPTVARGINKPPLTPKVATRPPTTQHQNAPIVTPVARRGPRSDLVSSSHGSVQGGREDLVSPASGLLSNNITPRSGLRQLRVDSANSTPTGTPTLERHDSWETRSGLGIAASTIDDGPRRPTVSFETAGSTREDPDSKFFYACDAPKPAQQPTHPKPVVVLQQKPATFFYANGETVPPRINAPNPPLAPALASPSIPQENAASKFVYANGVPDLPAPRPGPPQPTTASSVVSMSSRIPTSRPATANSQAPYSPRPSSPVKLSPYPAVKQGPTPTSPMTRSPGAATSAAGAQSFQRTGRPAGAGHARTRSLTSNLTIAEPPAVARIMSVHGSLPIPENSPQPNALAPPFVALPTSPTAAGFASLLQAAEEFAEEDEAQPESLNSPIKSPSQEKQLTDLVASARRERKVQDLEITNASLEAINRTLERQLRKQTAELRRYRRLSRSGRLSLNSVGSRVVSTDSTVNGGALARAGIGLDDLSEEESEIEAEEDDMEDEEDDFSGSESSGDLNPGSVRLRDARHRQRDERRLQLDLSKHQQLLIDSQKINQSLKRCLGWTEELIKEGKRALEYKVRVSEVEIGGRVLAPEDIEAREARKAREAEELAREEDGGGETDEDATLNVTSWGKDPQDRDSGIELPADSG
ncbi:hypothetical protein B0T16DRAFT_389031 [Cercophora newfieldiana]|uniref:Uncharacterized protein n=1 Tax=Cercophora newfieldiana TaxID=92897 RepID=A0AA39YCC4_9PEZI|nr:hypothetical protein B0T16DRAFT_389031 [Cercophora newfieldiana]